MIPPLCYFASLGLITCTQSTVWELLSGAQWIKPELQLLQCRQQLHMQCSQQQLPMPEPAGPRAQPPLTKIPPVAAYGTVQAQSWTLSWEAFAGAWCSCPAVRWSSTASTVTLGRRALAAGSCQQYYAVEVGV